jgi:hypothetical protein
LSVINDLLTVPERENGGRTAYDRFDFQTAWGISQILKLHSAGSNYALAFEFHDDIVELDDAHVPSKAIFYQLKTREAGNWTVPRIVARSKSTGKQQTLKASFAGKMFDNVKRFNNAVKKLVFVSNQPLSEIGAKQGEHPFSSASKEDISKFVAAMKVECQNFAEVDHLGYFHFNYCHLNLASYESTVIGEVAQFLQEHTSAEAGACAFTLYLANQGRKRSKSLADVSDFEALKKSKFVTKQNMEDWLNSLNSEYLHPPKWETVSRQLALPHSEDTKIEREWNDYMTERKRRWNTATMEFGSKIKKQVEPIIDGAVDLSSGLEAAVPTLRSYVNSWKPGVSDYFVKAVILYEYKR